MKGNLYMLGGKTAIFVNKEDNTILYDEDEIRLEKQLES